MMKIKEKILKLLTIFLFGVILAPSVFAGTGAVITIDFLGTFIGLGTLVFMIITLQRFSGSLKSSYGYIIGGISLQVIALIYTLIFSRYKLLPVPGGIDIHHLFMILGIVLFGLAAFNMKKIVEKVTK